jgi:hypothetical protein
MLQPYDLQHMLKTPATTRPVFRFADSVLYVGANWFFISKVIQFNPWLLSAVAVYQLLSFFGFQQIQNTVYSKRQQTQQNYLNLEPQPELLRRNQRLLDIDAHFQPLCEQARLKRELNDFTTTAIACVMAGNPFVLIITTALVLSNVYINYIRPANLALSARISGITACVGTLLLAMNPTLLGFATLAIVCLKAYHFYSYLRDTGHRNYGRIGMQQQEEATDTEYTLRFGKPDTLKCFNLEFEGVDRERFYDAFLFNQDGHFPAVNSSQLHFPANQPDDDFPNFVSDEIITTLNNAMLHLYLRQTNTPPEQQPFLNAAERAQAFTNVINQQHDTLAQNLAETDDTTRNTQLATFTQIATNRVTRLSEFCTQYIAQLPEQRYYTLLVLSTKTPAEISAALAHGALIPENPRIERFDHFRLPALMSAFGAPRIDQPHHRWHFDVLDNIQDVYDCFECFHNFWPAAEKLPIPGIILNFLTTKPYIQLAAKGQGPNGGNRFTIQPNPIQNLTSGHVLNCIAAYYIAICKSLTIRRVQLSTNSNRLRKAVLRFGNAYDVEVECLNPETGLVLEEEPFYALTTAESYAQSFDIQAQEANEPRAALV